MDKVMLVCTGNICRSAMAHGILEKMSQGKGLEVYSCGTSAVTGDSATYSAIEVAKEYDVDLSKHQATNMLETDIENMDLVLCVTENHKRYILRMYPNLQDRTYTMKEYAGYGQEDTDIKDPWGYDIETYRYCCREIYECMKKISDRLN